jgi:hypothetical protein
MENRLNDIKRQHKSIEYFVLMGVHEEDLKSATSYSNLVNIKPSILNHFPNHHDDKVLNNTNLLIMMQIVFPLRAGYIADIEDFDEPGFKIPDFEGYVLRTENKPKEFYHSFSYIYDTEKENIFPWHYGVFIFWEDYIINSEVIYIAKALLIISKKPYYVLFKYILEDVYDKYFQSASLEILIMNTYVNLAFESMDKPKLIKISNKEYFIDRDTILPIFDLNLGAFFSRFTIRDLLVIAEQFFKRHPVIICSEDISLLHPVYFTIMSLLYPLNITNVTDYYKFIVPGTFSSLVNSTFASITAFYYLLTERDIHKIVKAKQMGVLVIDIDNECVSRYDLNDQEIKIVNLDELKTHLIFNKIMKDQSLLEFLENTIDHLTKPDNNCFYAIDSYKNYNNTCIIRKQLFTYFTKLLTYHLPQINIEIKENNAVVINQDQEVFLENITEEDVKLFYSEFITTPSFDGIFQKTNENDPNLKNFIVLDELIKIITKDPYWIYFDKIFNFSSIEYNKVIEVKDCFNSPIEVDYINPSANILCLKVNSDHIFDSFILLQDKRLCLSFEKYFIKQNNLAYYCNEDNMRILFLEIESFIYLVETDTIILHELEQVSHICYMLVLSIEILSINDTVLQERKFNSIYNAFLLSTAYISKYSFMLSLTYEIIIKHSNLRLLYEKEFLMRLSVLGIQPTYNIYIKSNYKIDRKYYSQQFTHKVVNKYIYPEQALLKVISLYCINGCQFEPKYLLKHTISNNNMSIKCLQCKETDCLFFSSNILFTNYDDRIRHPCTILLNLLKMVIKNNGLRFNDLYKLFDTLYEDFRILLVYLISTDLDKIIIDNY